MSEVEPSAESAPIASTSPKKASKGKGGASKKARVKPSHPKTSDMVTAAIKDLKERGGSSLQAIKKYIGSNYKVDVEKLAPFIRKYLKSAVTSGSLVQTKGKGASGSFKLPASGDKSEEKAGKISSKTRGKPKKPKTSVAKKTPAVKKSASSVPKKAPSKPKVAKPATPSKVKKAKKAPTKKPKAPKPKKTSAAKPKAAKKAVKKK